MTIREKTEEIERRTLHQKATLSSRSRGRPAPEPDDPIRTCFQRDRDRIIHSKAFRRLKHKTQVFLAPRGDHYRTRLTHVLEVAQIARTIARALRLNEDLVEAIALGHDLGHTPFGHAGEAVLREIHPGGFDHYEQSLRIVDCLEKGGRGLNLTHEVRDGIVRHSKGKGDIFSSEGDERPSTPEGMVVRVSDIIAYVNHDLDDALRAEVVTQGDIPPVVIKTLGDSHAARINTLVNDVVTSTLAREVEDITMSRPVSDAVYALRDFLYAKVYESERILKEFNKARGIVKALYEYHLSHPDEVMPDASDESSEGRHRAVCDFVAGMTDGFALMTYESLFLPRQWTVI